MEIVRGKNITYIPRMVFVVMRQYASVNVVLRNVGGNEWPHCIDARIKKSVIVCVN